MQETILLGTYTRRESQGIYQITLDTENEELKDLKLMTPENSPTYLTVSQKNNCYTVSAEEEAGGIAAYDPSWQRLNRVTEKGAPLCYVAVDEPRQLVYGANYHKGEVNVYKIEKDGSLTATDQVFHQSPTGPHKNQDNPHVHYTDLTPDQRLAVCDLGTDEVYTYDIHDGKLSETAIYKAAPGTGPRHLAFHPKMSLAYLLGELDNTVTVLAYDKNDGTFTEQAKYTTLPKDFDGESSGAAIRVTKDARFLYASNRGHNSIAVFEIMDEKLRPVQIISTEGDFPRDFNLNTTEEYLVCANQNSDNLTLYRRDPASGELLMLQKDIYAPETVCVSFPEK